MTPAEERFVARRAYGEFAVHDLCIRLRQTYKKERTIYTVFLGIVCSTRPPTREEYDAAARPIIAKHPNPWSDLEMVSADHPQKAGCGIADLRKALKEPWPTRRRATKVEGDQNEVRS